MEQIPLVFRCRLKPVTILFALLFVAATSMPVLGFSEAGNFIFRTYSAKTYLASPQNWAALEDARGVMYFGNTDGLLEFDGVNWRRIPLPNAKAVRSLGLSDKGVVFVGGQNELGYLATDASGAMKFVSILDKLAASERNMGDVWSIVSTPDGVYFSTTERLILYHPKTGVKIWKAEGRLRRAFLIDGVLHVHVMNVGLHRLEQNRLQLAPGGDQLAKADIRGVFQSHRGTTLATTKGFFARSADGFEELVLPVAHVAQESSLYSVTQLSPDLVAFGTARGGLILATADGNVLRVFTTQNGLPSDYVANISVDHQGGAWLATGSGIVRFTPRLTYFNESNGLRGALLSITRWHEVLYVGTTSGLFQLVGEQPKFVPVEGMTEPIWSLAARENSLWVGTQSGLFEYDGKKPVPRLANKEVVYDISFSRKDANVLYLAMRSSAVVLRNDGKQWSQVVELPLQGEEFRTIADDENGIVWATTRTSILRADLSGSAPKLTTFGENDGLPKGWKNVFRIGGRLLFATEKGLVKLDADGHRFVPDETLGKRFADGSMGILLLREDPRNGNVWISGASYHGLLIRPFAADAEWRPMPFVGGGFDDLWALQLDNDGIVWAAGSDGRLARLEQGLGSSRERPLEVLVRRLQTSDTRQFLAEGTPQQAIVIQPSQNNLRLEFSAPFYDAPERVEYQVALDSKIDANTPWSNEAWKDLSNLWEGDHRLRVRARSPYGQVSAESQLVFEVLPPWYRTWWAYSLYAAVLGGLIWLVFRWRLKSLRENNRRLEQTVEERTAEIRQQRDQIQEQEKKTESLLLNILPAPVAAELRTRGSVAPMRFDDVTVCFTDFVGFTLSSEKIAAEDLVAKLHEYFTEFDKIITKYGLEKLKTIGDSYMFVSGLPQPSADHAERAVQAALEILEMSHRIGQQNPELRWRLRVGLHSGPVVAGVVGFRKFAFDIWGDTVNLASRMESSGAPDRVNLSERTYLAVQHKFECEARGMVATKDGRYLPMYFALGYKTTLEPSRAMST